MLVSSLTHHGYYLLSEDRYDPDWTMHIKKEKREFIVVLVCEFLSLYWNISLEDLSYKPIDDVELLEHINPIIDETVRTFANVSNITWHDDFTFLK